MTTLHFFLVDDDADDIELFEEVLKEISPSTVLTAAVNGKEALQKLRTQETRRPDVLFLDLNMPLMGGKECLKEIKADPHLQNLPVIMYTTSSHSKDIEETIISGALAFITKPTGTKELKYILSSLANGLRHDLQKTVRDLSTNSTTFIVSS
ncbi:MAG TPA: response regulator [Flavisolibacter sp.]|nr:response regulator [Flavisolibacter sp.]